MAQEAPAAEIQADALRSDASRDVLASISIRCFAVAFLLILLLSSGRRGLPTGVSMALGAAVLVLAVDRRNPFGLRNVFLVYTVALFAIGGPMLGLASTGLYIDLLVYVGAFLAGYAFGGLRRRTTPRESGRASPGPVPLDRIRVVEELMLVIAVFQLSLLALRIYTYGFGAFYGGQALLDQLANYGQASVSGGATQIVTFVLKFTAIAAIIVYVQVCLRTGVKIQYRYPLLLLVVLPIVSLARSDALIGATLVLIISSVERRIAPHRQRIVTEDKALVRRPSRRALLVGVPLVVALPAAIAIGGLRETEPRNPQASPFERSLPFIQSELTPIVAYVEIKDRQDVLERTAGSTILPPLLLKLVPRSLFPHKPLNSGAYYMSRVRPAEFAAGYALPPTLFGDTYLNFGMTGAIAACSLLGFITSRLDWAYTRRRLSYAPGFLLASGNLYGVLRNSLSESLAGVLLIGVTYVMIHRLLGVTRVAAAVQRIPSHG